MKGDGTIRGDLPWTRRPLDAISLQEKNIVVMGGTGCIGRALALCAAAPGAEVTIVGRKFRYVGVPRVRFVEAELSSMKHVRRLARDLPAEEIVHVQRSFKKKMTISKTWLDSFHHLLHFFHHTAEPCSLVSLITNLGEKTPHLRSTVNIGVI